MMKSLFLHYGPGGNSFVDKEILGNLTEKIYFWDQPKVKHFSSPFQSLVTESEGQIKKMSSPSNLIAHSFGCDIAASLLQSNSITVDKTLLISPLRHMPTSFINLGNKLIAKQETQALKDALNAIGRDFTKIEAPLFWNLVSNIASHPFYFPSFWQSQETMNNFISLASKAPAHDSEEFYAVVQNYLFSDPKNNYNSLNKSNTHVVLGAEDPYYTADDFHYWQQLLGSENVTIIKSTGHFPHLEQPSYFLKFI